MLHHLANHGAVFPNVDVRPDQEVGLLQHLDGQLAVRLEERVGHVVKLVPDADDNALGFGLGDLVVAQSQIHIPVPRDFKLQLRFVLVGGLDAHVHAHKRRQLLRNGHRVELTLRDVVLKFTLVGRHRTPDLVALVAEVGRVGRRHGAAVGVVQVEALELLFQRRILREAVVADAPVGANRGLEHVQRDVLGPHAQVGGHERRDDHILADGAKTGRVFLAIDVDQLVVVVELVLAGADGAPTYQKCLPHRVRVRAVVVHKRRWPSQHSGREVPGFLGRFIHVILQVVVVPEEALVIAADGAVGRQFHLEVADRLQRRTGVERLTVRLRVLVVQVGLLHEPPVGRSFVGVGAFTKPVAKHIGLLMTQEEG